MKGVDKLPTIESYEDPFQQTRKNEVKEFAESDYKVAEVKIKGTCSLSRERECYRKAIRQLWYHDIEVFQRRKKIYLSKGETW